jgi:putative GTP pyrophosphokinase
VHPLASDGPVDRVAAVPAVVPHDLLPEDLRRLLLLSRFAIDEVMTKVAILRDELLFSAEHNPIEHVDARIKSPDSIVRKAERKGIPLTADAVRECLRDLAGVRVTCGFVSDIYRVRDMIVRQRDLTVLEERDYVARPKANGYRSLHLIAQVPVFLSDRCEDVVVEIQVRTIAMDTWASLEHKIYYKYDRDVPRHLVDSLKLAADVAWSLDTSMERIHDEVHAPTDVEAVRATRAVTPPPVWTERSSGTPERRTVARTPRRGPPCSDDSSGAKPRPP